MPRTDALLTDFVDQYRPAGWPVPPAIFMAGVIEFVARSRAWQVPVEAFMLTVPFGLIVNGINDLFDLRSDRLSPRRGRNDGALLQPPELKPPVTDYRGDRVRHSSGGGAHRQHLECDDCVRAVSAWPHRSEVSLAELSFSQIQPDLKTITLPEWRNIK